MLIQNKRIRDTVSKVICAVFSGINRVIPKKSKQVLFYTNTGVKDNLKAVMDCMASDPDFCSHQLICSCDDPKGVPAGIKVISDIAGLFAFMRSGYVFYYNGKLPIKPADGQTVVNLWHGIPLKKIGRMVDPSMDLDFSTHYLAPSLYTGTLMQQAFGCDSSKILICGLPRCDRLFEAPSPQEGCRLLGYSHCSRIVAWMPTFRNAAVSNVCDSDLKQISETGLPLLHEPAALTVCNELLKAQNALLWIKLHPSESEFPQRICYSNILIQSDPEFQQLDLDYYRMLGCCEALITDYSSVYFDFLLLDRPLGFAVEDIASYAENRGFTADDPIGQMPGAILQDKAELLAFLSSVLTGQYDAFARQRKMIRELYCGDTDPHAAQTLLQKIHLKGA